MDDEDIGELISRYMGDFRRVFVEHPRVRYDGVYIAVCHYMYVDIYLNIFRCLRLLMSDAQTEWFERECLGKCMATSYFVSMRNRPFWVYRSATSSPTTDTCKHVARYPQFYGDLLSPSRFYPNGEVLSLLANEEVGPQQVIPVLKPTLRMKVRISDSTSSTQTNEFLQGLLIGNWHLEGTTVYITDLMDPSGNRLRYSFQMILELRSRPMGRWNRLDFRSYDSVSLSSGEATPLALKNDRPFWFSKVRSYATL